MKLALPDVVLCAATSVNVEATVEAMRQSMALADFGDALLLTDAGLDLTAYGIKVVPIKRITSAEGYSYFVLTELVKHINKPHCMLVQWDGFPTHPEAWDQVFLEYDYIGAPWPQFLDGYDVGNGGFSLRSKRLMEACLKPEFKAGHPEDVMICRVNRPALEKVGICYAERGVAKRFSRERTGEAGEAFGFHGVFNLIDAVGPDQFWKTYQMLDDRMTIWRDTGSIARKLLTGSKGWRRCFRLIIDKIVSALRGVIRLRIDHICT